MTFLLTLLAAVTDPVVSNRERALEHLRRRFGLDLPPTPVHVAQRRLVRLMEEVVVPPVLSFGPPWWVGPRRPVGCVLLGAAAIGRARARLCWGVSAGLPSSAPPSRDNGPRFRVSLEVHDPSRKPAWREEADVEFPVGDEPSTVQGLLDHIEAEIRREHLVAVLLDPATSKPFVAAWRRGRPVAGIDPLDWTTREGDRIVRSVLDRLVTRPSSPAPLRGHG